MRVVCEVCEGCVRGVCEGCVRGVCEGVREGCVSYIFVSVFS